MRVFQGRLLTHRTGETSPASIHIDRQWVRIVAGPRRLGAWALDSIRCERVTVFRFRLVLDGQEYTFNPDDPSAFSDTIGAVIDLRPKSRFGLGERVRAAREQQMTVQPAVSD